MKTKSKRQQKKSIHQFFKDHCFVGYWYVPKTMRKIRYTDEEIDFLYELRKVYIEAGRKRMVARGLTQYATKEELKNIKNEMD